MASRAAKRRANRRSRGPGSSNDAGSKQATAASAGASSESVTAVAKRLVPALDDEVAAYIGGILADALQEAGGTAKVSPEDANTMIGSFLEGVDGTGKDTLAVCTRLLAELQVSSTPKPAAAAGTATATATPPAPPASAKDSAAARRANRRRQRRTAKAAPIPAQPPAVAEDEEEATTSTTASVAQPPPVPTATAAADQGSSASAAAARRRARRAARRTRRTGADATPAGDGSQASAGAGHASSSATATGTADAADADDAAADGGMAAPKLLSAPVSLAANDASVEAKEMMDYMWGREKIDFVGDTPEELQAKGARSDKRMARSERAAAAKRQAVLDQLAAFEEEAAISNEFCPAITSTGQGTRQDILVPRFSLAFGGNLLIDDAQLTLAYGRHYGLVGRNGIGKSTLLRNFAALKIEGLPQDLRIMHVAQEIKGGDTPVLQTVLQCDREREELLAKEAAIMRRADEAAAAAKAAGKDATEAESTPEALKDAAELGKIYERLTVIEADTAPQRAADILAGLGFTDAMQAMPTKAHSGGWRMRVAIACALFLQPDVLLLDEPTNHLDFPAVVWLEEYLDQYDKTVVVVSHDRVFLNSVCTDVIHLHNQTLTYYKGDYDTFEDVRAKKLLQQQREAESVEMRRKHMQKFIDKFRYNAKRASLVQSRIKAVNKLKVISVDHDDPKWVFEFPDPGQLGVPVLQMNEVAFGYKPGSTLFSGVNFALTAESRVVLLGPNGAGKTTLLKLLMGELAPTDGHVVRNGKMRIAHFTQHHVDQLDLTMSPLEYLLSIFAGSKPDQVRSHLSRFGMTAELAEQTIGTLSGGQKSRVAFAVMSFKSPHVLIMDEITNHLDIETIDALLVALAKFQGAVLLVSHDQYFVSRAAEEIWTVREGKVTQFKGSFAEYKKMAVKEHRRDAAALEEARREAAGTGSVSAAAAAGAASAGAGGGAGGGAGAS